MTGEHALRTKNRGFGHFIPSIPFILLGQEWPVKNETVFIPFIPFILFGLVRKEWAVKNGL